MEESHPGAEDDRCDVQFQFVEESELDHLAQEVPPPATPVFTVYWGAHYAGAWRVARLELPSVKFTEWSR